ncbi:MAG: hypothetical protein IPJ01_12770 [Micavibrio sp.]|nr:hypothetical protein [Micavibrio sp.]
MPDDLMLDYNALRSQLGVFAGWGADPSRWNEDKSAIADQVLADGLRNALYPIDAKGQAVRWSFLMPTRQLATATGIGDYDLPDDFSSLDGSITYDTTDVGSSQIEIVSSYEIAQKRQYQISSVSGRPNIAAVDMLPAVPGRGTRYRLQLWPTPDATYLLSYTSAITPKPLGLTNHIPPGGPAFAAVLRAAVFAEFESRFNDGAMQWQQRFREALLAAIAHDAELAPEKIVPSSNIMARRVWSGAVHRERIGTVSWEAEGGS